MDGNHGDMCSETAGMRETELFKLILWNLFIQLVCEEWLGWTEFEKKNEAKKIQKKKWI